LINGISSFPLNFAQGLSLSTTPQTQSQSSDQSQNGTNSTTNSTTQQQGNGQQTAVNVLSTSSALANPNLATGQSSSSVLGAYTYDSGFFPSAPTQQSQLLTQIAQAAQQRFTDEQNAIQGVFQQKSDAITAQVNQWISVKASVNNAQASVTQAQKSIGTVTSALLDMRGVISNAAQDPKFNSKSFNASLTSINQQADRLGPSLNLVGSISRVDYARNTVEYRNNLGTGVSTLNGTYIGSDYRITMADGSVWVPDLNAGTLTHYSELQGVAQSVTITSGTKSIKLPQAASYTNGIKLLNYDDKTKQITLQVTVNPSDPPQTITGTLKQTGIGLMPAWFYDLSTAAGRDAAHKAVNEATARLGSSSATVQVAANTVATDTKNVDNAMANLNAQTSKAQLTELQQLQDLQTKYVQQVQAMQNNLSQLSSQQQNYIDAFASQISDDPFLNITI
jgi:hypothetical protein